MSKEIQHEFEKLARENSSTNLLTEFWGFLKYNKKWWLLPLLAILLALGLLIIFSGTAAAPFIYTLF
jgi:hypothetical protein